MIYTCLKYLWPSIRREFFYSGIKIFNGLSKAIKDISSKLKELKTALKHYLLSHLFYSLDEFFSIE
jgi:hypothetical protein